MQNTPPEIKADGPALIFGGPYSNLQATRALLAEAKRLSIPAEHIVCTGDLAAYCAEPAATIALMRESGIVVVQGNCDEQLGEGADTCGCGFAQGSACERLSDTWYSYANRHISTTDRHWLRDLPYRIDLLIGGRRLAVVHGTPSAINQFIFATSPSDLKRQELDLVGCDGILGGHCGLPFTELIGGRLWHNPGVIGMPANDGTARVWYSLLIPETSGLRIEHRALDYDHQTAARMMELENLPQGYADALSSGVWPNCDILPVRERRTQGFALSPSSVAWTNVAVGRSPSHHTSSTLLWPDVYSETLTSTAPSNA